MANGKPTSEWYVDNKKFLAAIIDFKEKCREHEAAGKSKPKMPDYIGECILRICTKFSYTNNGRMSFINYSFRDEMISDAVENCIRVIHSFDPEKSSNPFSYFTQVAYFAFLRRIAKEKKQGYIKYKMINDLSFESFDIQEHDDDAVQEFKNGFVEFVKNHQNFSEESYNEKQQKKKNKLLEQQSLRHEMKSSLSSFLHYEDTLDIDKVLEVEEYIDLTSDDTDE